MVRVTSVRSMAIARLPCVTEARLARIAMPMLDDIDMDTVDWKPSTTACRAASVAGMLPICSSTAQVVSLLVWQQYSAHNLREIADAVVFTIDNWDRKDEIGLEELMEFVKGPDFPTGDHPRHGIKQALATGRGTIVVRQNRNRRDEERTLPHPRCEIPYQVNKSTLISIAELVRDGKLDNISDLRRSTARNAHRH